MRRLTDTTIYKLLDKSNDLTGQIPNLAVPNNRLPLGDIQLNLEIIQRRFNYLLKNKVISDVQAGLVVPVFNPDTIDIPHFVPAVGMIEDNQAKTFVNLTNVARYGKNHEFDIDNRKLFALLQTGSLLREVSTNWNKIVMNATIMKTGAVIYAKMFSKILDRIFAINLNKQRSDIVNFVCAKFFLIYVLEKQPGDIVDSAAYLACYNDTTKLTVTAADQHFTDDAYTSFESFISNLATLDGLSGLTQRVFLQNWMKMYGPPTAIGLEYFPFFLHTLFSAMINAHMNSENIIEPLVGKETITLYNEIGRIIR
jgi:hypothetical protein